MSEANTKPQKKVEAPAEIIFFLQDFFWLLFLVIKKVMKQKQKQTQKQYDDQK
jgi:hypothetical protein